MPQELTLSSLIWPQHGSSPIHWISFEWDKAHHLTKEDFLLLGFLCYQCALAIKRVLETGKREIKNLSGTWQWIGESPGLKQVTDLISKAAPTDASILLTGQTGTGKEMAARMIHAFSHRAQKPFICVNCSALPETLLESELFGHVKGAFTGAHQMRIGKFEMASGGTLFLDEIGELTIETQQKLLRVLESKEFTRVGSNDVQYSNVRIIAATHRDLEAGIKEGSFREDLYYRLNVLTIRIPPLIQRIDDLPLLIAYFLGKFSADMGRCAPSLSKEAMEKLCRYHWPGNIRELKNALERALVLNHETTLKEEDFLLSSSPLSPHTSLLFDSSWEEAKHYWEKEYLIRLMKKTQGNVTEAASLAGIARQNLHEALKRHQISAEPFRTKMS